MYPSQVSQKMETYQLFERKEVNMMIDIKLLTK